MYYGYRCYNRNGEALGWFYTYDSDTAYTYTDKDFEWCKRWKTIKGAEKNFSNYNKRWGSKNNGGYLKIEVMPESVDKESPQDRRQKLLKEWDESSKSDLTLFKSQDFMTSEQHKYAQSFEETIEEEFALCAREMYKANKLACEKKITSRHITPEEKVGVNLASSEIDYIRKYWYNRLYALIEMLEWRNTELYEQLAAKYLKKDKDE
jgi:hypothetical protein